MYHYHRGCSGWQEILQERAASVVHSSCLPAPPIMWIRKLLTPQATKIRDKLTCPSVLISPREIPECALEIAKSRQCYTDFFSLLRSFPNVTMPASSRVARRRGCRTCQCASAQLCAWGATAQQFGETSRERGSKKYMHVRLSCG